MSFPPPALLIYDDHCAYCRRWARLVRRFDRAGRVRLAPYQSSPAQALLRAQFGQDVGFTLYLFTAGEVFWARAAARQVVRALGLPGGLGWIACGLYPTVVQVVSRLTRRRRAVCMPGRGACGRGFAGRGSLPLTPAASARLALGG